MATSSFAPMQTVDDGAARLKAAQDSEALRRQLQIDIARREADAYMTRTAGGARDLVNNVGDMSGGAYGKPAMPMPGGGATYDIPNIEPTPAPPAPPLPGVRGPWQDLMDRLGGGDLASAAQARFPTAGRTLAQITARPDSWDAPEQRTWSPQSSPNRNWLSLGPDGQPLPPPSVALLAAGTQAFDPASGIGERRVADGPNAYLQPLVSYDESGAAYDKQGRPLQQRGNQWGQRRSVDPWEHTPGREPYNPEPRPNPDFEVVPDGKGGVKKSGSPYLPNLPAKRPTQSAAPIETKATGANVMSMLKQSPPGGMVEYTTEAPLDTAAARSQGYEVVDRQGRPLQGIVPPGTEVLFVKKKFQAGGAAGGMEGFKFGGTTSDRNFLVGEAGPEIVTQTGESTITPINNAPSALRSPAMDALGTKSWAPEAGVGGNASGGGFIGGTLGEWWRRKPPGTSGQSPTPPPAISPGGGGGDSGQIDLLNTRWDRMGGAARSAVFGAWELANGMPPGTLEERFQQARQHGIAGANQLARMG